MQLLIISCLLFFAVSAALPLGPGENTTDDQALVRALAFAPRIIDGEPSYKQYYYEVAILSTDNAPVKLCSGALLSQRWVLTSAYCAKRRPILRVVYGTNYAYPPPFGTGGQMVDKVHCHPSYNAATLMHDIALLELNPPIVSNYISKVLLPSTTVINYVGQIATISGWGPAPGSTSTVNLFWLEFKQTNVIDNAYCTREGHSMSPYKLCTEDRAVCEGDQGSPLVLGNTIIGIASEANGASKCEGAVVTAYTRVNYYLGWIQQVTKTTPCQIC